MNIAIFASAFYPHVGGVEELVRQLARAYRAKGHSCVVITNQWPPTLPSREEYEGTPLYRFPMRIPEGSARVRLRHFLTHSRIRREVIETLKRHDIELIHVQCVSSNGYYAQLAQQATKLPLVVTTQGERTIDATGLYQRSAFMNATMRTLLERANFITACSRHTLEDLEQFFETPFGTRARVIYNGIEMSDFENAIEYSHPRPYILGIGRIVPNKGFELLIQAFKQANLENHDLLIAGEGPERDALERLVHESGLKKRVLFLGRADRSTAVSLFKGCEFFVLPSRQEPQGIVNLEAMAAGKAVIASNVDGVPEIVLRDQTGLLFPGGDVEELAAQMKRLADDPDLRAQLGQAGRERVQNFEWPKIADQYLEIYRSVLQVQA
ncbi:MAG TPA: glycosyltransferase family 4 protein [Abditibacteriaceae bacterium]|jgi:glycogen(starch) synthase|nr:glycosyltransferase family 4 protein [Abditibacteriaceae bacterium]